MTIKVGNVRSLNITTEREAVALMYAVAELDWVFEHSAVPPDDLVARKDQLEKEICDALAAFRAKVR